MHKCCGAMASVRRPTIAPPQRKRAPIRRLLSEEQRREVLDAFELFDIEKTGRIDYHELKVAIRALGFDIKKAEALRLVEEHDVQGTGTIGRDDFVTILTAKYASRDPHEELRKAFELFDADSTGRISIRNMRAIARELGESLTDDEMQAMIDEFDTDHDGEISFNDFARIMKSSDLYDDD